MAEVQRAGIFDAHHPPDRALIDECVHCGFCLPACPTYALWQQEMDSPRGRIYLMKMGLEHQARLDSTYVRHFDRCLGCMACMSACPSWVQYGKLIEATRAQIERNYPRSRPDRLFRWMLFALFPHPRRVRMLLPLLWTYQHLGIRRLVLRVARRWLPERLLAMEALLPDIQLRMLRSNVPLRLALRGPIRMRVGLMLGCVQRIFFDDVNAATARVLAAEGCEVVIPREQGCCGALMTHAGRDDEARQAARRMIDVFERERVDSVVINAAGCGSNMKEYGYLLRDDPAYAARARALASRCRDIAEVLAELTPLATRHPLPLRVAYQDACHLQHAQGVRVAPRQLLAGIPQLQVLEISEATLCCGSAGIYNLVEPGAANQLGERKAGHLLASQADAFASANPGCLLHIQAALRRMGAEMPGLHVVELLDASIRGVVPQVESVREVSRAA